MKVPTIYLELTDEQADELAHGQSVVTAYPLHLFEFECEHVKVTVEIKSSEIINHNGRKVLLLCIAKKG